MALNGASGVSLADWRYQTHVKNYRNFSSRVEFFSVVEIPLKHSSLCIEMDRPFLSSLHSLFQSESRCEILVMVISSNFNMNEN